MSSWMFGVITHKPADLALSLHEGSPTGSGGLSPALAWGVGWYEGARPKITKQVQASAARPSNAARFAPGTSRIYVLFLDAGVSGDEDERNLSPFHYRNWLFAQQGHLNREELFRLLDPPHAESLDGESGGEVFFHWIVQNIKKTRDLVPSLLDSLRQVGDDGVAFLLSNGRWLFAYQNGHPLYYLERRFSTSEHSFHYHVSELEADINSSTLATESAILISSKKLSGEAWCEIPESHLLAVTPRLDVILVDLAERATETA